ncbi:iron complex transport system substrate-binding protein [Paenibacillus phyllosphaerae]|uniref:Iron complex transport system substrate-binding protein n=1 Tax=Paenibacillus phyllosphaerae TaxID=274593 RepID=A0A7W5B3M4_9BACL|nr:ABC transporter substrate-binding protein [Paenibacillus phyllosphaerae]MBB3113809.1 iron complex transport system substrate-binding protein [Paenibacillus phyllosphaerae]
MRKTFKGLLLACAIVMGIGSAVGAATAATTTATSKAKHQITYNGKTYTVPVKTAKIVITGSVESLEDALLLNFKPQGALTVGGDFPDLFKKITDGVVAIGEKTEPDLEAILKLKPDIILSSTKFPEETNAKLAKIATTIPVSHIATDWLPNLKLLATLTGKQAEASKIISNYVKQQTLAKQKLSPVFKNKTVVAVRIRSGNLFIYPQDVFFNRSLYADLGASVPKAVAQAKSQQNISLESFAAINPDYVFVQFSPEENPKNSSALTDLQKNAIWKSLKAVKNGNVFVNIVDPNAQGGTAYSKIAFIEALMKSKLVTGK